MNFLKTRRHQSKKVRDTSRGKECRLLLSDHCSTSDTTVPCHIPLEGHGGMGTKPSDLFIVDGCMSCHDILDGRSRCDIPDERIELIARREMQRKIQELLDEGLVFMKGQK